VKGISVHLGHARLHKSREFNENFTEFHARRVPHPAHSPDRAPGDFFLLGTANTKLQNYEMRSKEDLILGMRAIFDEMPKATLNSVYISWITKLKWVITNGAKYFHKSFKNKDFSFEIYRENSQCTDFLTPLYITTSDADSVKR
jgi:hypothetical protein